MIRVKSRASYPYVPSCFRRSTKHQPRIHRCTVTITGEEAVFFIFFNKSKRLPLNSNLPRSGLRGELVVMKCGKRGQAISLTSRKDRKLAAWLAPRYSHRFSCTSACLSTIVSSIALSIALHKSGSFQEFFALHYPCHVSHPSHHYSLCFL